MSNSNPSDEIISIPKDGEWKPEHYELLYLIQQEQRCWDVVCVHPDNGHCFCMDLYREALS